MVPAAAATLPLMPVDTPEFAANPQPFLEQARTQHPWLARFSQGYVVHSYKAVCDLALNDDDLIPGLGPLIDFYGVRGTMWARFMEEMLISSSGAAHRRLRNSVSNAFTPRRANAERELMQRVISDLLNQWAPKGHFDFAQFASYFPVTVICGLLGVSSEPVERIRDAIEDHMASLSMDAGAKPLFMAAWDELWEFADGVVKEREVSGPAGDQSLLDSLIAAKLAGDLDDLELRFMVLTVIIAGYDTSKNQLTMIMKLLLDRPEMYQRCAEDLDFCSKVVLEGLRHSAIATVFRVAARDFSYDGVNFKAGETVVLSPPLANRDPSAYPDPLTFDPGRPNLARHAAFGRGAHICLGQFIARNQLVEGLHLIAKRIKNPRRDGLIEWRPFLGAWGLKSLPISFEPA